MLQYARVTADEPPEEHWASGQGLGRHAADARLRLSTVSLIAATGVLVVAAAYTAGRAGYASSAWADLRTGSGRPSSWCRPRPGCSAGAS